MNNKLTDKQRKLITDNYKLLDKFIEYTIRKRIIPQSMEDDFISDMYLKFCFSALKYDIKTGFKFSTYAYGGFQLGIRDIVINKKKKFDKIQYVDKINEDNLRAYNLNNEEFNIEIEILEDFVKNVALTLKERSMLEDRYYNKMSFSKLCKKYSLSKEGSRFIVKRAIRKLKQAAVNMDLEMDDFYR